MELSMGMVGLTWELKPWTVLWLTRSVDMKTFHAWIKGMAYIPGGSGSGPSSYIFSPMGMLIPIISQFDPKHTLHQVLHVCPCRLHRFVGAHRFRTANLKSTAMTIWDGLLILTQPTHAHHACLLVGSVRCQSPGVRY